MSMIQVEVEAWNALVTQRDALQRFKTFVHRRLDEAGIPTHPDGPHSKEGCRIGDRLDIAFRAVDDACKPWMEHTLREGPEWDSPLHAVWDNGVQHAVDLLATRLEVRAYTPSDGSESYDGDLGGTLVAIVKEWRAQEIYNAWRDEPGFEPWVPGGNSDMQWKARDQADEEIHAARPATTNGIQNASDRSAK